MSEGRVDPKCSTWIFFPVVFLFAARARTVMKSSIGPLICLCVMCAVTSRYRILCKKLQLPIFFCFVPHAHVHARVVPFPICPTFVLAGGVLAPAAVVFLFVTVCILFFNRCIRLSSLITTLILAFDFRIKNSVFVFSDSHIRFLVLLNVQCHFSACKLAQSHKVDFLTSQPTMVLQRLKFSALQ